MSYQVVGACPRCGAPVYVQSPWWGVIPPPTQYSCTCHHGNFVQYVTTTTGDTRKAGSHET